MIKLLLLFGKRNFPITVKLDRYISKCKKVYLIACWARYGVREYPLAYYKGDMPYVWYFDDHNGVFEEYRVIPITMTTTGYIKGWTDDKGAAECQAMELNKEMMGEL